MSQDQPSSYYNKAAIEAAVRSHQHRAVVGGLWEQVGQLQLDFLRSQGLKPQHTLIDIGCGSLRAGVKLIRYLDSGNYYGTDLNASLLDAGYDIELRQQGLTGKLPRSQLVEDAEFDFSWCPVRFDFALAQSLFTHLPLSYLRLCLERLQGAVAPGASFFATIFEIPDNHPMHQPFAHAGGVTTHGAEDPYHHRFADVEGCCRGLPWRAIWIGPWNHPRSQHMVRFVRSA